MIICESKCQLILLSISREFFWWIVNAIGSKFIWYCTPNESQINISFKNFEIFLGIRISYSISGFQHNYFFRINFYLFILDKCSSNITNGRLWPTCTRSINESCEYDCIVGYTKGFESVTCTEDNQWSNAAGEICVIGMLFLCCSCHVSFIWIDIVYESIIHVAIQ